MKRNTQDELITDVYRAKLVYEAEMKLPEYRAKGEEDFEFIGKALAAKGYCKASEIFEEIDTLICRRMLIPDTDLIDGELITDIAELKKKYEVNKG